MTHNNGASQRGLYDARVHISKRVTLAPLFGLRWEVCFGVVLKPTGRTAHGNEMGKPVSAVYVHTVCDRPQTVTGIEVPVALHGVCSAPEPFVGVLELDTAKVVHVPPGGV